jgi:probable rRNA maturation factor
MPVKIYHSTGEEMLEPDLVELARFVAERLSIPPEAIINIILADDDRMNELNDRFRGEKVTTDCLSFNLDNTKPDFGEWVFGEVYVGQEVAKRQSQEVGSSEKKELALLIVHGLLHLTGWDDDTERSRREMMTEALGLLNEYWVEQ